MTENKKEFSIPLFITQASMLVMLVVTIGITIYFAQTNIISDANGFNPVLVYLRISAFMLFYGATFWFLRQRSKVGLALAFIFFSFYLIRNIYGIYINGLDDSPVEQGGFFNITDNELAGAQFARKYGVIFVSLIQASFIAYFALSTKIRRIFGINS